MKMAAWPTLRQVAHDLGSGRLLLHPKTVVDRENARYPFRPNAGEVLVCLGGNDAFQADIAVLNDDVDWGDSL